MHEPLPECIDRLARIETTLEAITENHLDHIYEELKLLRSAIKETQKFIVAQIIGVGVAMLGILAKVMFFG